MSIKTSTDDSASARPERASPLFDWLRYLGSLHVSAIDMGLSRVLPVADALGITQINQPSSPALPAKSPYVFTVAGTNGKGSTTATIAKICELAGYKTALYQSPHVMSFTERVKINDTEVSEQQLIDAFIQVDDARIACELSLSFFEMTTLAAMLIFTQAECDVWVLEIGLGGRLDVVNIIDPDVAVITNVGIDHVDWLGDDIHKIGFEKAGILREGIPCVLGSDSLPHTVHDHAKALHCEVMAYGVDYAWQADETGETWSYSHPSVTMLLPMPSLSLENASAAVTAVLASRLVVTQAHLAHAMQSVGLIGRFQVEQRDGKTLICDAAHNPDGVTFLLRKLLPLYTRQGKPEVHIVFSMLADKDMAAVVSALRDALPYAMWHVAPLSVPRAASEAQLSHIMAEAVPASQYQLYPDLASAYKMAYQTSQANAMILTCGSFHSIHESQCISRA